MMDFDGALSLDLKFAVVYFDKGHVYDAEKRSDDALAAYRQFLELQGPNDDPKNFETARERVKVLSKE